MTINPFLLPVLFDLHNFDDLSHLSDLAVDSHLMIGHFTGFGKLIDEKILPKVFNTTKLNKKFRKSTPPFQKAYFDEIDHLIKRDKVIELLSLKAGKWTIQLTMACKLNNSFEEILKNHKEFEKIVVGTFYGKRETLTDKYDIICGINRGEKHDVKDLTKNVFVYPGKEFWSWLNEGEARTQEWVLNGIITALEKTKSREEYLKLLVAYKEKIGQNLNKYIKEGKIDWVGILKDING